MSIKVLATSISLVDRQESRNARIKQRMATDTNPNESIALKTIKLIFSCMCKVI